MPGCIVYPWTGEAIRKINESGMKSVLVTNQSGVGRGYFNESTVNEVHQLLRERLLQSEAQMDAIYYCPHVPGNRLRDCRKPKPGMILQAARDLEIDLSQSFMIGDRYTDVLTAHTAGIRSVLVCSGDGVNEEDPI
jgi:D-glycero-D-manno-heptose 1,7-bisphosphate phosphatase